MRFEHTISKMYNWFSSIEIACIIVLCLLQKKYVGVFWYGGGAGADAGVLAKEKNHNTSKRKGGAAKVRSDFEIPQFKFLFTAESLVRRTLVINIQRHT